MARVMAYGGPTCTLSGPKSWKVIEVMSSGLLPVLAPVMAHGRACPPTRMEIIYVYSIYCILYILYMQTKSCAILNIGAAYTHFITGIIFLTWATWVLNATIGWRENNFVK